MPGGKDDKHLFDDPRNVKLGIRALYALCAVLFVFDIFFHRHIAHPFEALFGFYSVYGFVACVLLVLIAKEMRKLFMRDERHYDDE